MIFNMADGILTPCNVARSWHWFRQVTAPCKSAMWHVALESWQWIHQVAAPCNVICGSGMKCRWIRQMAAPCNVTRSSGIMTLNSRGGSTLQYGRWLWDDMPWTCPNICPNICHIGILHPISFLTTSPQSTCHSARVCKILSKSDHPQQKYDVMSIFKMAEMADLRHLCPPSCILGVQ